MKIHLDNLQLCACRRANTAVLIGTQQEYKRKGIPTQAWTGPLGLQEVEAPRISRQSAHEGDNVASRTHQPPLSPGDIRGTHFY